MGTALTWKQQQPAAVKAVQAAAPAKQQHLVICVVTGARSDVTLMTAISMLRLQSRIIAEQGIKAEMHFMATLNDALEMVHSTAEGDAGALVVSGTHGFDAQFVIRAMRTDVPLLLGVHPLPTIDWERVKTQPAGEEPHCWGNVYNVKPARGGAVDEHGYMEAEAVSALDVMWLRARVLRDIVARHPEVRAGGAAGGCAFACEGVYDNARALAHERFLKLYGGKILADPEACATSSGPTEFGGRVGARSVLR